MDEHRRSFSPTLWYLTPEQVRNDPDRRTHLKQCWFPGVHTDVGRGYEDHAPNDIADITFVWMVDQCSGLLDFNMDRLLNTKTMFDKGDFKVIPGAQGVRAREDRVQRARNWGMAYLHDSMTSVFKLGGSATRTPGQYVFGVRGATRPKTDSSTSGSPSGSPGGSGFVTKSKILEHVKAEIKPWHSRLFGTAVGVFTGPPVDISKLDPVSTCEVIHPCVRLRLIQDPEYDPPALRDFRYEYDDQRSRWTWTKEWTDDNGKVRAKRLHEYQIPTTSLLIDKATMELLKMGEDSKEPIPPRKTRGWLPFL